MSSITVFRGVVPVGGIIPLMSNLTGAHLVPATGIVDDFGWQYCDGSVIPAGNTLSGNTPNLTDDRFLQGSTSAGTVGASTDLSHTHSSAAHTHTMGTHSHNMKHTHQIAYAHSDSNGSIHFKNTSDNASTSFSSGVNQVYQQTVMTSGGSSTNARVAAQAAATLYSTGVISGNSGTGAGALTSSVDPGDTNSTTPTNTGTSLSSATNNRPKYLAVQYVIRVK